MGLTLFALNLLRPYALGARVLALGYPDVLATPAEASAALGKAITEESRFKVAAKAHPGPYVSTRAVFEALGADVTYVDRFPARGVEIQVDLNEPFNFLADWMPTEGFDLVIDAGTVEHCANVGQALMNAARSVKHGGAVFHSPPLSMVNHGYYNVCPVLLWDFYVQNGWRVEHLSGFKVRDLSGFEVERDGRCRVPEESALYFVARNVGGRSSFEWPSQRKYSR